MAAAGSPHGLLGGRNPRLYPPERLILSALRPGRRSPPFPSHREVVEFGRARSGCFGGVSSADPRPVTFRVTQALTGTDVGEEFELTTNRDGASCSITAEEGQLWLVGLQEGAEDIGLCDPGGALDQGFEEAVDALILELEGEG